MTLEDKILIEKARFAGRTDYGYIDSLKRRAQSDEARRELERMSHDAFVAEKIAFDCEERESYFGY